MKRLLNTYKFFWTFVLFIASAATLSSCHKEELEIQQDYPFEVKVMPVPKDVANGQAIEIRISIERSGNFNDARYYIRYFQFEGQGTLQYYQDAPYLPNDLYQLQQMQFRLYYTSQSEVSQSFDIWISDNSGNERQLSFQFNNSD